MRRKYLIAGLISLAVAAILLLIVISPALAFSPEDACPIGLDVISNPDYAAVGMTVLIKQDGKEVASGRINEDLEVIINLPRCVASEAIIKECQDNPVCHRTVSFGGGFQTFDISSVRFSCESYIPCPACPGAGDCLVCPDCPTTTSTLPLSCEDQGYILEENCPDAPEGDINSIVATGVITALIVAVACFGGGIKIYKNRLGEADFTHRHRGIRGYHKPDTRHRNVLYRHRRWSEDPIGCLNDVKRINEGG